MLFASVVLIDNADGSTMLDKRYVTNTNQLSIRDDLFNSLFVLTQPRLIVCENNWPCSEPPQNALMRFYEARHLSGDAQALGKSQRYSEWHY